jgi:hypothetical protein
MTPVKLHTSHCFRAGFRCHISIHVLAKQAVPSEAFLFLALMIGVIAMTIVVQVVLFLVCEVVVEDVALELPALVVLGPYIECPLACWLDNELFNCIDELYG